MVDEQNLVNTKGIPYSFHRLKSRTENIDMLSCSENGGNEFLKRIAPLNNDNTVPSSYITNLDGFTNTKMGFKYAYTRLFNNATVPKKQHNFYSFDIRPIYDSATGFDYIPMFVVTDRLSIGVIEDGGRLDLRTSTFPATAMVNYIIKDNTNPAVTSGSGKIGYTADTDIWTLAVTIDNYTNCILRQVYYEVCILYASSNNSFDDGR